MPKTALLSLKGEKIKDIKLDDNVWGITPNDQVVYEHINLFMANRRQGTHATKTRSDVSGGDKKELVMLVKDLPEHHIGLVVELYLGQVPIETTLKR